MPGEGKFDSDDEGKDEGKYDEECKSPGGGGREMGQIASDADMDNSSNDDYDVRKIRLGDLAIVKRSDGTWRHRAGRKVVPGREL